MIVEIGDWVFREAARQVRCWQRGIAPDFQVSANKSPVQFRRDAGQYQGWLDYLRELALPPQSIVVEISEGALQGVKIDPSLAQTLDGASGELALLVDAGSDYAQGHMFGRPMTAAELEKLGLR